MADLYANYADLAAAEQIGVEYDLVWVERPGSWVSIAIHGGGIEPGTSEVAEAVAGTTMGFYEFDSHVTSGSNTDLHITSANFDEPQCEAMVTGADRCLSFHGYTGTDGVAETLIGGLDVSLRNRVQRALESAGFTVSVASSEYPGTDPANICNRTALSAGVQLEMSRALRESFFTSFTRAGRKNPANRTADFVAYVAAIRSATVQRGALVSMGSVNVSRWCLLTGYADVDLTATFSTDQLASGGSEYVALTGRWVDASNCYLARVDLTTTQQVVLTLRRRQSASDTVLDTYTSTLTHAVDGLISVRFQLASTTLRGKVWQAGTDEPDWQASGTDSAFTAAGSMGLRHILSSAYSGTLPVVVTVTSFEATELQTLHLTSTEENGPWTESPDHCPMDLRIGGYQGTGGEQATAAAIGPAVDDTFGRTVSSGVGTAPTGQVYSTSGGSASDYAVNGSAAVITQTDVGVLRYVTAAQAWTDLDVTIDFAWAVAAATGGPATAWLIGGDDLSNYTAAVLTLSTAGQVSLTAYHRAGGVLSSLSSTVVGAHAAGNTWRTRLRRSGSTVVAEAHNLTTGVGAASLEVDDPDAGLSDGGGIVGWAARRETGNTDASMTLTVDNLTVSNPQTVTISDRGVNGVLRAWDAGTEVDVWARGIMAL